MRPASVRSGAFAPLARPGRVTIMAGMPASKRWPSADLDAVIARVTPDVLALLGDGAPRTEAAIVAALAGRHAKDDVALTLVRLDVLERLAMRGSRYVLPAPGPERG